MAQDTITKCLGLVTQYNSLSIAPGALSQADDCVITRENIIQNRRGHAEYGSLANTPMQLMNYMSRVIAHHSSTLSYDNGSGTFSNYTGTYDAPANSKMHGVEAVSNLYITTSKGVKVLTDIIGTEARSAGAPRSLDPSYSIAAGTTGFLGTTAQCAYRVVIKRTDSNGNVLYGYPSTRIVAYNTDAVNSRNVTLTLYIPAEVTILDTIQVYRTEQQSGTSTDLSGDDMGLVYQASPSASDITNKYISFTDSIVDALRGANLYTNSAEEGIQQANERPPLCKDLALYRSQYMFFANTSTKQRLSITLVGTSGLNGKSITLGGLIYTFNSAASSENAGTRTVQVGKDSGPTGVAAVDIDYTARSLVRVINRTNSNTSVYAYYTSGPDELPGAIVVEEQGVGGSAFTISTVSASSSSAAMFFPTLPIDTTSTSCTSSNSVQKNYLYYSKSQQPEHVPLLNYIPVGPANKAILRIAPLRDSLIIVKEEGIYRLTGDSPQSFSIVPLDLTVYCKALESVVVLANQVMMISNQGVVSISDTGVQVISREIEPNFLPLISYSNLSTQTYACAYESERSYLISTISNSGDTQPTQTFVFNTFTRTWVRWTYAFTSAIVEASTDILYFTKSGASKVYRERKSFSDIDYSDPESTITLDAIAGKTVTFTLDTPTPFPGWTISQGGTSIAIDSISSVGSIRTATLIHVPPATWVTGSATLYPSVPMSIKWHNWSAAQPGLLKHIRQIDILVDSVASNNTATSLTATFTTDLDGNQDEVDIDSAAYRWDTSPWGEFPWGGVGDTYAYPTYVPRNKQYCRLLNLGVKHSRANEKFSISGCSFTFDVVSERVSK